MSRIEPYIIDQIKQAADIVEVVGDYVPLKRKGANMWACCPFHGEKSPSFSVSPSKGIYKCFGCSKAGDAVRFVMDIEGIGYPEALRQLAKKYGIEIKETEYTNEEQEAQNERESLLIVLNFAKDFYQKQLFDTDDGRNIGLTYFKERGFNEQTINDFQLGFSNKEWDSFTKEAEKQGFSDAILDKAGLTIFKKGETETDRDKKYDRFRDRVIFPIHNISGKVIAFGGRILTKDKNQPKYVNSPETEVYHKSDILYGIFQAKNAIRTADMAFLCEGYTDVISLHQAGIHNVVASSGTSLTIEQIKLIHRFTTHITVLYDGDAAGIKASMRGMDMILEEGLKVRLATFPEGEDPDSFVQKIGSEAFTAYIKNNSKDFITYKAELNLAEAGDDPIKKAEVIRDMVQSISKIPDALARQTYTQRTAEMLDVKEDVLIAEANKLIIQRQKDKQKEYKQPKPVDPSEPPADLFLNPDDIGPVPEVQPTEPLILKHSNIYYQERECLRLLLNFSDVVPSEDEPAFTVAHYIMDELEDLQFITPLYKKMLEEFRSTFGQGNIVNYEYFLQSDEIEFRKEAVELSMEKYNLSDNWLTMHDILVPTEKEKIVDMIYANVLRLKKVHNQMKMKDLQKKLKVETDTEAQNILIQEFLEAKLLEKEYAKILGTVILK